MGLPWDEILIEQALYHATEEDMLEIIQDQVDQVLTVSETGITDAMALICQHFRLLIEPSSATVIAAITEHRDVFAGRRIVAIISGGNVDIEQLPFKP